MCLCSKTPRQAQKEAEHIVRIFKKYNLSLTIEANLKQVNFLDVTLDLANDCYKAFCKVNHTPEYVHTDSNHPPSVLKQIPVTVEKRISNLCLSQEMFDECKGTYQDALHRWGHKYNIRYNPD